MSLAQPLGTARLRSAKSHPGGTFAYPERLNVRSQFLSGLDKQKSHFELSGSADPVHSTLATLLFDAAGTIEFRRLHFLFSRWFDNVAAIDLAALNLDQAGAEHATEGAEVGR